MQQFRAGVDPRQLLENVLLPGVSLVCKCVYMCICICVCDVCIYACMSMIKICRFVAYASIQYKIRNDYTFPELIEQKLTKEGIDPSVDKM